MLDGIMEKLKIDPRIDSVFVTGSRGENKLKPFSDIDLVIVFFENTNNTYCLYQFTEGIFTEVFFFEDKDIDRIAGQLSIDSDEFDAIFTDWVRNSDICFDKTGKLMKLKEKVSGIKTSQPSLKSKKGFWQRINHNYITDKRYFDSNDPLYHEALDIKLLYSVEQVVNAYFAFRDISWRGEKTAVLYLKNNDPEFYGIFRSFVDAIKLSERFDAYERLFHAVHAGEWKEWDKNSIYILDKNFELVSGGSEIHTVLANLLKSK